MKRFDYYYIRFLLFKYKFMLKNKIYIAYENTDLLHYYLEALSNDKNLSDNQKGALQKYGEFGKEINQKLRTKAKLNFSDNKWVDDLDSALEHLHTVNFIVFRKLDLNIFENNNKYFEMGYLSTSTNLMAATMNKKYLLVILVPASENIKCLYIQKETKCGEDELLIQRNTYLNKLREFQYKNMIYQICRISEEED